MSENEFRIEKDSLGELKVPAKALYGVQTERAVENFPISGLRPWRAFIWSVAVIKRAAAEVNMELGLFRPGSGWKEIHGKAIIRGNHHSRAGSDGRKMGCGICGGPVPSRGRHESQHERQ